MRKLTPITIFILYNFIANTSFATQISAKLISIHDGDTITVQLIGEIKKSKVRFVGIDTPELDFNGHTQGEAAQRATDYLKSLLPIGSHIEIELGKSGVDANGRYLGQVIIKGMDVNLEMLKAGWAAVYFIYPYDKKLVYKYSQISKIALENEMGIFSPLYKDQVLPYIFRQLTKGTPGTNIVADFETKKMYNSDRIDEIPSYNRVFFTDVETAQNHGFVRY